MIFQEPERQQVTNKGTDALPRLILRDQELEQGVSKPGFSGAAPGAYPLPNFRSPRAN